MTIVSIDIEDAQALAQNLSEHMQYDGEEDLSFWEPILCRLNIAIRHAEES